MNKYKGIFVKNDINGNPMYVGDKVRVTRGKIHFTEETDYYDDFGARVVDVPAETWEGEIVLLLSKGIRIRTNGEYIHPNLTDKGYVKWIWEKL